ncbi:MAG: thiamine-phosphate kinase [Nitrospira sp.]|nr:thiamine-phosphate kinase [Nitrospira sp.]
MKLSQVGELSLIKQIRQQFKKNPRGVIVGIGDDAAVIKPTDKNLLVTTDTMVEGVHFDLSFITPSQLGFKLVSVNVSDIYAMGGKPAYILLNMAMNKNTGKDFFDSFFDGVHAAMKLYKLALIGGDLSSSKTGITLSATLIGYAKRYIPRSGADAGDKIYVTGNLGDSACGLELLKKIKKPIPIVFPPTLPSPSRGEGLGGGGLSWNSAEPLLRRHLLPEARNPERFVDNVTSMIDLSDGLLIDLSRLCDESKVGARIYLENVPLSSELREAASCLGISPTKLALSGGEDYELLFTAPSNQKVKAIYIGKITKSERVIVDSSGRETTFSPQGYQHFVDKRKIW